MARIRTVKPEFWTDEKIVQLPFHVRILFIGMWNFCDDQGCITDSPERIRLQILPADHNIDVEGSIDLLVAVGLLDVLMNDQGDRALHVINWTKHQKIDNPSKPKILGNGYKKISIPSEQRRLVAKKYGCLAGESKDSECYFCGTPGQIIWHKLSSGRPSSWVQFSGLEIDHLIPEVKGGQGLSENLVLSCRYCNRGRRDRCHIDFLLGQKLEEKMTVINNPSEPSPNPSEPSPLEGKGREGKGEELNKKNNASENSEKPETAQPVDDEPDYLKTQPRQPHDMRSIFGMTADWQPTQSISALLIRSSLVPDHTKIDEGRLSDFVNHWIGRPDQKTQDGWHGALVGWLKRTQHDKPAPKQQNGYQPRQDQQPEREYKDPAHRPFEPLTEAEKRPSSPALIAEFQRMLVEGIK